MPRKTVAILETALEGMGPSMRPRPDAAENAAELGERSEPPRPSMRPRPDAAENVRAAAAEVLRIGDLQ